MVPTFLITLREGLEAALIVGIIVAYLVRVGRHDALPLVWAGVGSAIGGCVLVGVAIVVTVGRLPLVVQETLEGLAGLLAVGVLTWMLFWMRRQGRAIKGELERGLDVALSRGSTMMLAGLAFIAVGREGLETVLFLLAIGSSAGPGALTFAGGVAGLVAAALLGWGIFTAGIRIDLRRFFTITGIVLIFVAAGLVAFAIAEFGEAGLIVNGGTAYDLGGVLPETGPLGAVLAGLFGYRSSPTPLELTAYLAFLVPTLAVFVASDRPRMRRQRSAT